MATHGPHPRSCRGSGAGQGHWQAPTPPHHDGIAVNRKPHPGRWPAWQRAVPAAGCPRSPRRPPPPREQPPVPRRWRMGLGWQEVAAAPVMLLLLLVPSTQFWEATSLIKLN